MDVNFFDSPDDAPQPRDQIRMEEVRLEPYPDGRRVRISMRMTPFGPTDRPNLDIVVRDESGMEVATMSVIESLERQFSLTIHLRGEHLAQGPYEAEVSLFYEPGTIQDSAKATFTLPPAGAAG